MDFNTFTCVGYIPKDPKFGTTSGGKPYISFALSVRTGEKKEGDQFPPSMYLMANIWGRDVDRAKDQIKAGKRIVCSGTLNEQTWEKDGVKQKGLRLNVHSFQLLSKPDPVASPEPQSSASGDYDPFGDE